MHLLSSHSLPPLKCILLIHKPPKKPLSAASNTTSPTTTPLSPHHHCKLISCLLIHQGQVLQLSSSTANKAKRDISMGKSSCLLHFSMWDGLHLEMFVITRVTGLESSALLKAAQFWSSHKGSCCSIVTAGRYKAMSFQGCL